MILAFIYCSDCAAELPHEPREHPRDAAVREAREETGREVEADGLVGIWLDDYGEAWCAGRG